MMFRHMVRGILLVLVLTGVLPGQQSHPRLMLTSPEAEAIRAALGTLPALDTTIARARRAVDAALARPMDVPRPLDAGGPAHQRHKENYTGMQQAGILFAVTGEERYARFVRDMFMLYVDLWPTLPVHPMAREEAYGRLFWQSLNETVWLVHATQAYDCVYSWLSPEDRTVIETKLLRPMAEYFVKEHTHELDRIHNHGTWTVAAVGMAGYVMGDEDLIAMSLKGSAKDGTGGFLRQLDLLFSPGGFYTEGPYYVRYAIMPFVVFAQVIQNNDPGLKIFQYRDQILRKAFYAAMQQTYTNGAFIPFNDAMKEKTFLSPEIIIALDIVFEQYDEDPGLLWIAQQHGEVLLNGAGLKVARALHDRSEVPPFPYGSVRYTDGADGNEGGIGMLRYGPVSDQSLVLLKYTGHGLSHGHFDKLGLIYYDQGREILQDYGAARFINVEPKYGGRYLPENSTWAKQTIAHNTLVVDGRSHFGGKREVSDQHHGVLHYFDAPGPDLQVMSATMEGAFPGVSMQRTVALAADERFANPLVIDIFRVVSAEKHAYDLAYYYQGHLINTNVALTAFQTERRPLGTKHGYQHLWVEAEGKATGAASVSWLNSRRYYTLTTSAGEPTTVYYTRIGASDPDFNLRSDPGLVFRRTAASTVFATVIEPHGTFDPIKEFSVGVRPTITAVRVLASTEAGTVVELTGRDGFRWVFMTSNQPADPGAQHEITVDGTAYRWTGTHSLQRN